MSWLRSCWLGSSRLQSPTYLGTGALNTLPDHAAGDTACPPPHSPEPCSPPLPPSPLPPPPTLPRVQFSDQHSSLYPPLPLPPPPGQRSRTNLLLLTHLPLLPSLPLPSLSFSATTYTLVPYYTLAYPPASRILSSIFSLLVSADSCPPLPFVRGGWSQWDCSMGLFESTPPSGPLTGFPIC